MELEALGLSVIVIFVFSVLGGVLATRLKQPSVLGVLIAGALAGPHALGLITDEALLHLAIEIGAILLLFLVGIEFSIQKLLDLGLRAVIVAVIKIGILFFGGYHVAVLFGLPSSAGIAIGVILSLTSTVIFLKILEQKGMSNRPEIPLLIAVLIIEDLFGIFSLTFFSSLAKEATLTPFIIVTKLVVALALLGSTYLLLLRVLKPVIGWLSKYSTDDTITFIAISLCAVMSYFAHSIGLSTAVGAFLAGNIVASLRNADVFEHAIHPFILTFTSLFFFSIGTVVDFGEVFSHFWLVIALFLVIMILNFTVMGASSYLFSIPSGRSAVFTGLAMLPVGEFSLLIANEANKLAPSVDLVSITASIIFLSSLAMSILISKTQMVYNLTTLILPKGIKYDFTEASRYCRTLSSSDLMDKFANKRLSLRWRSIGNNLLGFFMILAFFLIVYNSTQLQTVEQALHRQISTITIVGIIGVILLFPTFTIIRNFRDALLDLSRAFFRKYPHEIANQQKIVRNFTFIVLLFLFSFSIPAIISVFRLHPFWSLALIPFVVLTVILVMKIGRIFFALSQGNKKLLFYYVRLREEIKRRKMVWKMRREAKERQVFFKMR